MKNTPHILNERRKKEEEEERRRRRRRRRKERRRRRRRRKERRRRLKMNDLIFILTQWIYFVTLSFFLYLYLRECEFVHLYVGWEVVYCLEKPLSFFLSEEYTRESPPLPLSVRPSVPPSEVNSIYCIYVRHDRREPPCWWERERPSGHTER